MRIEHDIARPHRLVAQDSGFSVQRRGFKSPWGCFAEEANEKRSPVDALDSVFWFLRRHSDATRPFHSACHLDLQQHWRVGSVVCFIRSDTDRRPATSFSRRHHISHFHPGTPIQRIPQQPSKLRLFEVTSMPERRIYAPPLVRPFVEPDNGFAGLIRNGARDEYLSRIRQR